METDEIYEQIEIESDLVLTFEAQKYLREAGKWAYFLGIIGFVFTGLIVLMAIFASAIFSLIARLQQTTFPSATAGVMSFIYVIMAVFYFCCSVYLYQFGNRIKSGIFYNEPALVTTAVQKLNSFFKLWGITTIIIISIYTLAFIIFVVLGVGTASLLTK